MALVVQIPLPDVRRHLSAEESGVKNRVADECQNFSRVNFYGNCCAGLITKGTFSLFLNCSINCQNNAVADGWVTFRNCPQYPSTCIDFKLTPPIAATNIILKSTFDPVFTDVIAGIVIFESF